MFCVGFVTPMEGRRASCAMPKASRSVWPAGLQGGTRTGLQLPVQPLCLQPCPATSSSRLLQTPLMCVSSLPLRTTQLPTGVPHALPGRSIKDDMPLSLRYALPGFAMIPLRMFQATQATLDPIQVSQDGEPKPDRQAMRPSPSRMSHRRCKMFL